MCSRNIVVLHGILTSPFFDTGGLLKLNIVRAKE
jgi:hypothetical protein